jgi:hypothetical protein
VGGGGDGGRGPQAVAGTAVAGLVRAATGGGGGRRGGHERERTAGERAAAADRPWVAAAAAERADRAGARAYRAGARMNVQRACWWGEVRVDLLFDCQPSQVEADEPSRGRVSNLFRGLEV